MARTTISSLLRLTLAIAAFAAGTAFAQAYPNRPIRLIVPFPPGGGNDVIARIVGQKLSERLGQPVVIDNKGGGNGVIGLNALAQAAPDGYTLGVGAAGPLAVNPSLYENLSYDPLRDFAPITNMVNFPLLLVTHPSLKARNVTELIALAKAQPGKIFYASPGSGNSGHLAGELFNSLAKVSITHVPYRGQGPAVSDLLAGQVQMLYSSIPSVIGFVQQGRLNALAVGSAKRLNHEIVEILRQKDVEEKLTQPGAIPVGDSPEQFGAYIAAEMKKWGAVVKSANIKAD
jgi:tripartite-type tricarboxylate transporter receptor subunit TctC